MNHTDPEFSMTETVLTQSQIDTTTKGQPGKARLHNQASVASQGSGRSFWNTPQKPKKKGW